MKGVVICTKNLSYSSKCQLQQQQQRQLTAAWPTPEILHVIVDHEDFRHKHSGFARLKVINLDKWFHPAKKENFYALCIICSQQRTILWISRLANQNYFIPYLRDTYYPLCNQTTQKKPVTINQPQSTTQIIVQKKLSVDFTTINVM